MSSMPIVLNTRNPDVKSINDFTDKDRIALPSVGVSHQALLLQMAAAKEWGFENYKKLDYLTVGLGQMDAVAAMLSPGHEVTTDFPTPPFLYIEREQPGIRTILTMKEILRRERHHRHRGREQQVPHRQSDRLQGADRRHPGSDGHHREGQGARR